MGSAGYEQLVADLDETAVLEAWERNLAGSVRAQVAPDQLRAELSALYRAFVAGVRSGDGTRSNSFDEVRALLSELSTSRARRGFSPTETASSVFALKDALFEVMGVTGSSDQLELSRAIDDLGLFTFERFAAAREAVILNQSEQLLELSTPVVKLWDGILAVPLVGTLDSARTLVVMETLLQMLVDTGSAHAIIDITGVAAVDTQVAQHLLKTVHAARLMGAECIISGIRPQIAQTVVALGIEFGDIATRATLADALRHVLNQAGYDVVLRPDRAS
ncbi:MAG: STAS domain-containing protein [Acidimicrobiales bacterium]